MGQVSDPNLDKFSPQAFEEPGDKGLTPEQLALRVHLKREQGAQDAGWIVPPGPDEPTAEAPTEEVPDVEPEEPAETEPDEVEEPPEEEEPGPEADPEAEAQVDAEGFYLASYRTRESAEEALAEKDRTIDRLFKEMYARAEEPEQQEGPVELDVAAWNEWAEQAVERGEGENGAMQALQNGGPEGFNIYIAHWASDPQQTAQAIAFNNQVQQHLASQYAVAAVAPYVQDFEQRASVTEAARAKSEVAAQYPDFDDYEEEMNKIAAPESGLLPDETRQRLTDLAASGPAGKKLAWEFLYMAAASSTAPQRRKEKAADRRARKAASDQAKVQATVSSSEATALSTPLSEDELKVVRKKNAIRQKLGQPLLPEE